MNVHIFRDWTNEVATVDMDGFQNLHFDEKDMFVLGWIYTKLQELEKTGNAKMITRRQDGSFKSPKLYERWVVTD